MKRIHTYLSLKILFTLVFALVFNNKISANNLQTNASSFTESFSFDSLNDNDLEAIYGINLDACGEEVEEDFSNDFSATFSHRNIFIKKDVTSHRYFTACPFSSVKKRYYILYCQLKLHS